MYLLINTVLARFFGLILLHQLLSKTIPSSDPADALGKKFFGAFPHYPKSSSDKIHFR
jgi:hypothetical protein